MRGDGGVAGEGRVVGVPKFHSWGECNHAITEYIYQLRLDVQRFLLRVCYLRGSWGVFHSSLATPARNFNQRQYLRIRPSISLA